MINRFNLKLTGATVALALAGIAGTASAGVPGYVASSTDQVWTSPYGLCWKTTDWTPEKAAAPCDAVPVAQVAPPPVAVAPPPPVAAPAPTPLVVAPPPAPVIEQISLSNDVLFEFDKADLKADGQKTLDEISSRLKGANVAAVSAIGHADRIGPKDYNQQLSEKRATTVREYLSQKGVEGSKVRSEGRGQAEPVTGDQCKSMKGSKLIECLQPDRRVDIEVRGEREVAGTSSPSAGGTTGSGTLGTPGGASSGASPASGSSSSGGTK